MTHLAVPPFRCPQSHQNRTWRVYRWFNPHQWILKSTSTLKEISGSGFRLPYGLVWTCFENLGILRSSCSVLSVFSVRKNLKKKKSMQLITLPPYNKKTGVFFSQGIPLHLCNFEFHEIWKNQWNSCNVAEVVLTHSFISIIHSQAQKSESHKKNKKQSTQKNKKQSAIFFSVILAFGVDTAVAHVWSGWLEQIAPNFTDQLMKGLSPNQHGKSTKKHSENLKVYIPSVKLT